MGARPGSGVGNAAASRSPAVADEGEFGQVGDKAVTSLLENGGYSDDEFEEDEDGAQVMVLGGEPEEPDAADLREEEDRYDDDDFEAADADDQLVPVALRSLAGPVEGEGDGEEVCSSDEIEEAPGNADDNFVRRQLAGLGHDFDAAGVADDEEVDEERGGGYWAEAFEDEDVEDEVVDEVAPRTAAGTRGVAFSTKDQGGKSSVRQQPLSRVVPGGRAKKETVGNIGKAVVKGGKTGKTETGGTGLQTVSNPVQPRGTGTTSARGGGRGGGKGGGEGGGGQG